MKKKLIYLAVPYSHSERKVREQRYNEVTQFAGELLKQGYFVYSPITHSHPIAYHVDLPKEFQFWRDYCLEMLRRCDELWVLCLPGWKESEGVMAEIKEAKRLEKEIIYVTEDEGDELDVDIIDLFG